jgi:DNA-binding IclR family transcriptional regulator
MPRPPAQPNRSLIDGLEVLQAVVGSGASVGSRALAAQLGLEPTRVNRLLKTLAHLGLTEQDDQRRYRPGPALHVLTASSLYGSGLLQRALPVLGELAELADDRGLVLALGVLWRDKVAYLLHREPGMPMDQAIGRVGLYPADRSGIGVAVLAAGPPADDERPAVQAARDAGHALLEQPGGRRGLGVALPSHTNAGLAISGVFPARSVPPLVRRLHDAAEAIADAPPTTRQRPAKVEALLR